MKATDLNLLVSTSHPTLSPDGSLAVVAVTRPDIEGDAYVGQLWQVPTSGTSEAKRLTRGFRDTKPEFSPDGTLLAFLRASPGESPQLHVVAAAGGEPLAVTDRRLGVSDFAWSPGGDRLVFVSQVPEEGRYGTLEGVGPSAEPGRTITTTRYLSNGVGYVVDQRDHLFVVAVPDVTAEPVVAAAPRVGVETPKPVRVPEATQLTTADADHRHPRFTPDGGAVTFVAALHDGADTDLRSGAYRVSLADGHEVTVLVGPDHDLGVDDVLVTTGGTTFLLASDLGPDGLGFVGTNPAVCVLDAPGETPRRLTDPDTLDPSALVETADGSVLVSDTTRGTVQLVEIAADGRNSALTTGPIEVTGAATVAGTTVVTYVDPTSAGAVAVLRDGGLVTLADFSAPLREAGVVDAVETVVEVRDGTPIQGWVLTPAGEGPHPVLLVIHGGPYSQYTGSLFDEAQVYADAGYAVVMCNPRGASGYGQAFGRAIQHRMGTVDMTDVLDFLDGALAANATFDGSRVGIMGGSYGGYLTAWTIAHDHRFAGAIVERGFLDPEFFIGTSDIGDFFVEQYTGADVAAMAAQSPQAVVGSVTTPTFVIHSEDDLRCPLPQAERYFLHLRRAGVESQMLVFPGEDHELSRSGRPRHRVQRFDAILDWWATHLPIG